MQNKTYSILQRILSLTIALALVLGLMPHIGLSVFAQSGYPSGISTEADPETLTRPTLIYGDTTLNAGKITVGKSVAAADGSGALSVTVNGKTITADDPENFLITITQTAQVMGMSSESSVPLDVVFILDTSGSMEDNGRAASLLRATNSAISTLLGANENNRIGVVAFSSEGYGGGTSNNAAASVLSDLKHYTGTAASAHLQQVNWQGQTSSEGTYIAGRNSHTIGRQTVDAYRNAQDGGTNIQAGIIAGAQMLLDEKSTTVTYPDGAVVTRMPVLILISDGQPTYTYSDATWYDPSSSSQQGPGSGSYEGNGFLAALTAAYYKGAITEKYYGKNANEDARCSFYTVGVEIEALDDTGYWEGYGNNRHWVSVPAVGNDQYLAETTLDPQSAMSENTQYWQYGNTWDDKTPSTKNSFSTYWNNYLSGSAFSIRVHRWDGEDVPYTLTKDSIANSIHYVTGKSSTGTAMYSGSLAYNDQYINVTDASNGGLETAFQLLVSQIQLKAVTAPTKVTGTADFSGYVNFYDPIGEYMEVKDIKGILANGNFYQGLGFAARLATGADAEFNDAFKYVLTQRLALSESNIDVDAFIADAKKNANGSNNFCWWGVEYDSGEEDIHMQVLGSAKDDSISYIEDPTNGAPAKATYVCRSYFFYGTAGDTAANPNHDYLYFVIRVQRSLTAPYQQTVCISAPASLLSVEKVMVNEDLNGNFSVVVEEAEPARVVYEVGLRSDINAQNVSQIVSSAYTAEAPADTSSSLNYDPETNTYYFFANDWDRSQTLDSHHRAQAKATFDAAADNAYYTYQQDTPLLIREGNGYTLYKGSTLPAGTYYYARTYYDWTGATAGSDGSFPAEEKTAYIAVSISEATDAIARASDNSWYIKAGMYTASTLIVNGDDTIKTENTTGTSSIVNHPHRTGDHSNSHYTVFLGNNGRLALVAEPVKSVSGQRNTGNSTIYYGDGDIAMVGDRLTYTIKVVNNEDTAADAIVTDTIPAGTKFISASSGSSLNATTGAITWLLEDIPAHSSVSVSFVVEVTEDILQETFTSIHNTATITIGNNPSYQTNTTTNPPVGKVVEGATSGVDPDTGVQAGDELIYRIRYVNNTQSAATILITDHIPAGTTYVAGTASHGGTYQNGTLTWTIENVAPGRSGIVTFRVMVTPAAQEQVQNAATIRIGTNGPSYTTNSTNASVKTGNLQLTKKVTVPAGYSQAADRQNAVFTLRIHEIGGVLNDLFAVTGADYGFVLFENGKAYMADANGNKLSSAEGITIKHNQTVTILGLTAGTNLSISEVAADGYTPSYSGDLEIDGTVTIPATAPDAVTVQVAALTVTNEYSVTPAPFQLHGVKKVTGSVPAGGIVFTFTSRPCDALGNPTAGAGTAAATATITDQNREVPFSFSPRSFTLPGNYYYLITEVQTGLSGVTYDTTEYLLTVTVTDNGQGVLSASHSLKYRIGTSGAFVDYIENNQAATSVSFTNRYTPEDIQLTLVGNKQLSNLALLDSVFSFQVLDADGNVVTTGQNRADGSIEFRPITYTANDLGKTFTYTVTEVNSMLPGIRYDSTAFTVTVSITVQEGVLQANVTYPTGGIRFANAFDPGVAEVRLLAQKILTGERTTVKAGEFSFEVVDSNGAVVATGTTAADGSVAFGHIGYTLAMLEGAPSKTFTYTMQEVIPDLSKDPFIVYSTAKYAVAVTVSYNSTNGELTVSDPVYTQNGAAISTAVPQFTNVVNKTYVEFTPDALNKQTSGNPPAGTTFGFSVINAATGTTVGTGLGQANGAVNFSALRFDAAGTYHYWVQETNAGQNLHGIAYDSTRYLLTVVVDYDAANSQLKITSGTYWGLKSGGNRDTVADYTEPLTAPHFENAYHASGSIVITATKVMTGRTLHAGEFTFVLEGNGVQVNGTVDADGNITFAPLYYNQDDIVAGDSHTLTYVMREVIPTGQNKLPGVTYDTTEYTVEITLTDNNSGTIQTGVVYKDASGQITNPIFRNHYHPVEDTSTIITAFKELTGRDLAADEFSFELVHVNGSAQQVVEVATNTADGKVEFIRTYSAINFPANQLNTPVRYLIREVKGGLGGVTYSTAIFGVEIIIHNDISTGKLYIDENETKYFSGADFTNAISKEDLVFTNNYHAQGTAYTPVGNKVLTGRDMLDDEFSFFVKEFDLATGTAGAVVSTGLSKAANAGASGAISFTPIGYRDRPGANTTVYLHYVIGEIAGHLGGVQYTDQVYYMTVALMDDGLGAITATATYYTGYDAATHTFTGLIAAPQTDVTFTNRYTTTGTTVQLEASKELIGRDLVDSEFDFVVTDANGNPVTYGTNDAQGNIVFGTIAFDKVGTYVYTMSELEPVHRVSSGITMGGERYTVTIQVTDNGHGSLEAAVQYSAPAVFRNTYAPASATVTLQAWKYLINKNLQADEFTFQLSQNGTVLQTVSNQQSGLIHFNELTFHNPGEYIYTIQETAHAPLGTGTYVNDPTIYTVKIVVTDNLAGRLLTNITYYKGDIRADNQVQSMDFFNTYTPKPITLDLSTQIGATKAVSSVVEYPLLGNEFQFEVTDVSGNVVARGTNGKSVDGVANITFDAFTFNAAGIYMYHIREVSSQLPGISSDPRQWGLHIHVRYNEQTGLLYVDAADIHTHNEADSDDLPSFVNRYDPLPVNISVQAHKELTGRPLFTGDFRFQLVDRDTGIVRDQVGNDANGAVNFHLVYTTPGTYQYEIREVNDGKPGVTYDTSTGLATVIVTDSDLDGRLEAVVNVTNGTFENTYRPTNGTVQIPVQKVVSTPAGIRYVLSGGEFSFHLLKDGKVIATVQNDYNGNAVFDLQYDPSDLEGASSKTFYYTIQEVIPAEEQKLPGITYDNRSYQVAVTVTDDLQGHLSAVVENSAEPVVFTNRYDPKSVTVDLEGIKHLIDLSGKEQKTLADFEFKFVLADGNGNILETVSDNGSGFRFSGITYTAPTEQVYYIYELNDAVPGVLYDTAQYKVLVTVVDQQEGALKATVTFQKISPDGSGSQTISTAESIVFANTYQADQTSVTFTGTKVLTGGRKLKANEFSFILKDANGKELETVTNTADGKFSFQPISYTQEGTYVYTLEEVKGNDAQVTYDGTKYTITVTVTDANGTLKASTKVTDEQQAVESYGFTNLFTPENAKITLRVEKLLENKTNLPMALDGFRFDLYCQQTGKTLTATSGKDGLTGFDLSFSAADVGKTYTYTLSEYKGAVEGMTYSDAVYQYQIAVSQNEASGELVLTVTRDGKPITENATFLNIYEKVDQNPQTGDLGFGDGWLHIMLLSSVCLLAVLVLDRKKRNA